jgi:pimeloyl-ACP methyl ester carboxylesterase
VVVDREASLGGAQVWVTEGAGGGPAVVFLHSSGAGARQWRRLQLRLDGVRQTAAVDLPGTGRNAPWTAPQGASVDGDLAVALGLIDEIGGPVWLVGHSYGGHLALRAAVARPEAVIGVVAHEPVVWSAVWASGGPAEKMALFQASHDGLLDEDRSGTEAWMRSFVDFWNGAGAWDGLDGLRREPLRRVAHKVFTEVREMLLDRSAPDAWAPSCPVRLTRGAAGPWIERRALELSLPAWPDAQLVEVPGGHLAPMTDAAAWWAVAAPWLGLEAR